MLQNEPRPLQPHLTTMGSFLFTSDCSSFACDIRASSDEFSHFVKKKKKDQLTSLPVRARKRVRAVQIRCFSQAGSPDSQISQGKQRKLTEIWRGGQVTGGEGRKGQKRMIDSPKTAKFIHLFHVLLICCAENRKQCNTCSDGFITLHPGSCWK